MDLQRGLWWSLQESIDAHQIELYEEYLDIHRLPQGSEKSNMAPYLKRRYWGFEPDVIVAVGPQSIDFSRELLSGIFPDSPLIFAGLWEGQLTAEEVTQWSGGVFYELSVPKVLELVMGLLPDTQEIVLVGGSASFDQELLQAIRLELEDLVPWHVGEITDASPVEIEQAIQQLAEGAVVLFTTYFMDYEGNAFIPRRVLERIAKESPVPIFGFFDTMLGAGAVGVVSASTVEHGRKLGKLVLRMVAGESAEEIGVLTVPATEVLIDDRGMQRYDLDVESLPAEAKVFYGAPGLLEAHPVFVFLGSTVVLIQTSLILALLWARREKQKAESQAVEMERYFSTVFRESPNPKAVLRVSDCVFQDINPAYEEFFGIKREDAIGRTAEEVGIRALDQDPQFLEDFFKAGRRHRGHELKVQIASGDVRSVELFCSTVEIGGVSLYLIVALDVSDRIQAEKLRHNLARDNRIAQLGQISASIAHEINQPLGSILSNAESALMHLDALNVPNQELREILAEIKSEDRRATRVVENIRAMLGGYSESKAPVNLLQVIDEAGCMVQGEARRRGIDLCLPPSDICLCTVVGERVLLVQVLLNLIFNAMDAVESLPASQRLVVVDCDAITDSNQICVSVSDYGRGIPPNEIAELFEFYYSTKKKGMGLGLAISRYIIEDHRGRISVGNLKEGGACFKIWLPSKPNDA
ncbi:ATP-binding protein [Thalassobacterium sedimentorum]|nr:ATP-binding protein [Coraliomargarita sp. SDUM461004]